MTIKYFFVSFFNKERSREAEFILNRHTAVRLFRTVAINIPKGYRTFGSLTGLPRKAEISDRGKSAKTKVYCFAEKLLSLLKGRK